MKKNYLFACISVFTFAFSFTLSAQLVKNAIPSSSKLGTYEQTSKKVLLDNKGDAQSGVTNYRTAFWSEDFSGGLNGSNGQWTESTGDNGNIWNYVTTIDPGCYSTGSEANFTTAGDGFLVYHADSFNCVTPGQTPVFGDSITTGSIISPSIDLSAESSVLLTFEQNFRYCCSGSTELWASVSNDGGVTWTDYNVVGNTDVNDYPDNDNQVPELVELNITGVAANQPNVQIKFTFNGTGVNATAYFWAIDDIELSPAPDYELGIQNHYFGSYGAWQELLPYFQVPVDQVTDVEFSAEVFNNGNLTQNNAFVNVNINSGLYDESSATSNIPSLALDSLAVLPVFNPGANTGTYTADITIDSDAPTDNNTNNNSVQEVFEVTDYIYARDRGPANSTGGAFNSGNGYSIGNVFDIYADQTVWGVDFHPSTLSELAPGLQSILVTAELYEIDLTTGDFNFVTTSDDYFLEQSEFGSIVSIPFTDSEDLTAGSVYLPIIKTFGNGGVNNDLVVSNSGSSAPQTTFIYLDDEQDWFFSTSTPIVRLNFDPILSTNNISSSNTVFTVSPNPVNDNAVVEYSMDNTQDVSYKLTDLTGKVVMSDDLGVKNAGSYVMNINVSSLAEGTYLYTLITDGNATTKRIVVSK